MSGREEITAYLKRLQQSICDGLEETDGAGKFSSDAWEHVHGGGGLSRVISGGRVFEKGGVNFSAVEGELPSFMKDKIHPEAKAFFATGVSLVIHPHSPHVPIVHMNVRYFETDKGDCWFGGGIDLTPVYIVEEEASLFHRVLKKACDPFDPSFYHRFKDMADDYFFIPHRKETRGVGGIFFDYLKPDSDRGTDFYFGLMQEVGNVFLPSYVPIVEENKSKPFTEEEKQWQRIRRGRYVEFNLVYDRGTRFGLETGGRIESILMSLPPMAAWEYNYQPAAGSREEKTLHKLVKGRNYV